MKNKVLFAFAAGKQLSESNFRLFKGVANLKVVAVNPNKEEYEQLYGPTDKEFSYVTEKEIARDGIKQIVKYSRVEFHCRFTDNPEYIVRLGFLISDEKVTNKDLTKAEVMDNYGQTAWASRQEIKNKEIPTYTLKDGSKMKANIDSDYRVLYRGEKDLTLFLRTLVNISDIRFYNSTTRTWELNPNTEDCKGRLDFIEKVFNGDFSEIKDIAMSTNNSINVMLGIRSNEDNRQFQSFYTRLFLKGNAKKFDYLYNTITKDNYVKDEYYFGSVIEHKIVPTEIPQDVAEDLPQDTASNNDWDLIY